MRASPFSFEAGSLAWAVQPEKFIRPDLSGTGILCCGLAEPAEFNDPAWWAYQSTRPIGLAVADSPEGEWKRIEAHF